MNIDLVFPKLPPALDGIGDHTACLAEALAAAGAQVRVLTAQEDAVPIPGVAVERVFSLEQRRGVRALLPAVKADPPDWLILQFNQFSYGRWGLNPYLPLTIRELKRNVPALKIAWMAHEEFVPITSWRFAVMTIWQRMQFWILGQQADLIFFTIERWLEKFRSWFPGTLQRHLPVGSNIPDVGSSWEDARRRLRIDPGTFVVGYFGTLHGSRLLSHVRAAVERLQQCMDQVLLLYVGPHGKQLQEAMPGLPVRDAGALQAEDVSRHFSAMDLYLTPVLDGISTRRGAFMTGLQHGVPTVGTRGPQTDELLQEAEGEAFVLIDEDDRDAFVRSVARLANDEGARKRIARAGKQFYQAHFDWPVLANRLLAALQAYGNTQVKTHRRTVPLKERFH